MRRVLQFKSIKPIGYPEQSQNPKDNHVPQIGQNQTTFYGHQKPYEKGNEYDNE
jgi:hypothetical protein